MKTIKENGGRFSGSAEELVLRAGFLTVILWLASCLVTAHYAPNRCTGMLRAVGYHAVAGRAAGIPAGLQAGLPPWLVVLLALATDVGIVFLLYPAVVYSYEHRVRRWFVPGRTTVEAAETGRKRLARWGVVGIVFFVWFPFYGTGPLVGAVIGYFLGLRLRVTMAAVCGGTLLAIVSWMFVFDRLLAMLREHAAGLVSYVPLMVVGLVLLGLAAARVHLFLRRSRARKAAGPTRTPAPAGQLTGPQAAGGAGDADAAARDTTTRGDDAPRGS